MMTVYHGGLEPEDFLVVRDNTTLRLLADPFRQRVISALQETPRTAKELAAFLEVPKTRLYHHLNKLEAAGVIRVVETRVVSGITERRYRVTAYRLTVDRALFDPHDVTIASPEVMPDQPTAADAFDLFLDLVLEGTRTEVRRAIRAGLADPAQGEDLAAGGLILGRKWVWLRPDDLVAVRRAIVGINRHLARMNAEGDPEARPFELLTALSPVVPPEQASGADAATTPRDKVSA